MPILTFPQAFPNLFSVMIVRKRQHTNSFCCISAIHQNKMPKEAQNKNYPKTDYIPKLKAEKGELYSHIWYKTKAVLKPAVIFHDPNQTCKMSLLLWQCTVFYVSATGGHCNTHCCHSSLLQEDTIINHSGAAIQTESLRNARCVER